MNSSECCYFWMLFSSFYFCFYISPFASNSCQQDSLPSSCQDAKIDKAPDACSKLPSFCCHIPNPHTKFNAISWDYLLCPMHLLLTWCTGTLDMEILSSSASPLGFFHMQHSFKVASIYQTIWNGHVLFMLKKKASFV